MKKFTPTEWEIIVHRLEATDAIVEVLTDDDDTLNPVHLEDSIYLLILNGCKREFFSDNEMLILRECAEGSTFFAGIDEAVAIGEVTQGWRLSHFKAAKSLGAKLGVEVTTI